MLSTFSARQVEDLAFAVSPLVVLDLARASWSCDRRSAGAYGEIGCIVCRMRNCNDLDASEGNYGINASSLQRPIADLLEASRKQDIYR